MNGATTIQERLKDLRLNKGLKLEELAEQDVYKRQVHALQRGFQLYQHIRRNVGGALDEPRRIRNHALRHIEHRHDNIKGVGKNEDGTSGFGRAIYERLGTSDG